MRIVPFTSSVAPGLVVPMPTLLPHGFSIREQEPDPPLNCTPCRYIHPFTDSIPKASEYPEPESGLNDVTACVFDVARLDALCPAAPVTTNLALAASVAGAVVPIATAPPAAFRHRGRATPPPRACIHQLKGEDPSHPVAISTLPGTSKLVMASV